MDDERSFAVEIVKTLKRNGHEALFAGGCVRDEILGLAPADFDVATSATPEQVQKLFRKSLAVGAAFGVVEILGPRRLGRAFHVQVATFRSDGAYLDGRRPSEVQFGSAKEDAKRRDFTINGMFFDPIAQEVIDFVGGKEDLRLRIVRAIGDPTERIREDKLRVLRAVRMAARFGFAIEDATWKGVVDNASAIHQVSPERIADELRRIFSHPTRLEGLRLLVQSGLYRETLPILAEPSPDIWTAISHLPHSASFPLVLSLLARENSQVESLGETLRLSRAETGQTQWLLTNQAILPRADRLPNSLLFPILAHPDHELLLARESALTLARAEPLSGIGRCLELLAHPPDGGFNPPPLLDGNDLKALGIAPGPAFAKILRELRIAQLDHRIQTDQQAKDLARDLYQDLPKGKGSETA